MFHSVHRRYRSYCRTRILTVAQAVTTLLPGENGEVAYVSHLWGHTYLVILNLVLDVFLSLSTFQVPVFSEVLNFVEYVFLQFLFGYFLCNDTIYCDLGKICIFVVCSNIKYSALFSPPTCIICG